MTDYLQRRRYFKKNARGIIYSDWLSQIFVFAAVMVSVAGLNSIYGGLMTLAYNVANNDMFSYMISVFYTFLTFAFVLPLVYGVIHFEILAFENKKPSVSRVFDAFANTEKLTRTYKTFLSFVLRIIPVFIPVFLLSGFIQSPLYYSILKTEYTVGNIDVVYLSFNIVLLIFVFLSLSFTGKHIVGLFIAVKNQEQSVGECFRLGKNVCSGYTAELCLMTFSFVPLIVVSMFTLGIMFIVYTLPYILLTFSGMTEFLYSKYMCKQKARENQKTGENTDFCQSSDSAVNE